MLGAAGVLPVALWGRCGVAGPPHDPLSWPYLGGPPAGFCLLSWAGGVSGEGPQTPWGHPGEPSLPSATGAQLVWGCG